VRGPGPGEQHDAGGGQRHPEQVDRAAGAGHGDRQRARNSTVTATPSGIRAMAW